MKNPIIANCEKGKTADPYIIFFDDFYHHVYATQKGVYIARSKNLEDIGNGEKICVYNCEEEDALLNWFAPELHFIDNKWYIYAAPQIPGTELHGMYVLESYGAHPFGEYKFAGAMRGLENRFTIDGTILEYRGENYFIWTTCREIFIAKMLSPTEIENNHSV